MCTNEYTVSPEQYRFKGNHANQQDFYRASHVTCFMIKFTDNVREYWAAPV